MTTCKFCGEPEINHPMVYDSDRRDCRDCELTQLRALRDKLVAFGKPESLKGPLDWRELDAIITTAEKLAT